MDDQLQSLQRLNELSEKLVSSSNNQEFAEDVHAVTERVQAALPIVRDRSNRLSIMLQCFEHQQCTQKHVTFLEEVKSRLEVEFCLDGVVDVENELEVIKVRKGLWRSLTLESYQIRQFICKPGVQIDSTRHTATMMVFLS